MSQPGDNEASEQFRPMDYRLMSFAVAIAQLVVLAPSWLTVGSDVHSGIGMFWIEDVSSPWVAIRLWMLLFVYILLAVVALFQPPTTGLAFACAVAGLAVTILLVLSRPSKLAGTETHWTGAPVIAVAMWVIAIALAEAGWSRTRRARAQ